MPHPRLTILREYATKIEAETIRIRLAAAGIGAMVTGEDAATALGMGGAITNRLVRLEVPESDYDRAAAILKADDRRVADAGPWICSRCREQNEAAFEVCWSCSKPRTQTDATGRLAEEAATVVEPEQVETSSSIQIPPAKPAEPDSNPYRPVIVDQEKPAPPPGRPPKQDLTATEEMTESVTRCFRAAVVGTFLFAPLVSLYGVYLLLREDPIAYRCRGLRRRLIWSWCINGISIPTWTLFWIEMS